MGWDGRESGKTPTQPLGSVKTKAGARSFSRHQTRGLAGKDKPRTREQRETICAHCPRAQAGPKAFPATPVVLFISTPHLVPPALPPLISPLCHSQLRSKLDRPTWLQGAIKAKTSVLSSQPCNRCGQAAGNCASAHGRGMGGEPRAPAPSTPQLRVNSPPWSSDPSSDLVHRLPRKGPAETEPQAPSLLPLNSAGEDTAPG